MSVGVRIDLLILTVAADGSHMTWLCPWVHGQIRQVRQTQHKKYPKLRVKTTCLRSFIVLPLPYHTLDVDLVSAAFSQRYSHKKGTKRETGVGTKIDRPASRDNP